jgi:drug/metabolite transporter (DMT)-like permease
MLNRYLNPNNLAVLSLLYSASMWGLIWYPLRLLDEAGMSAVWTSLVMYAAATLFTLPLFFKPFQSLSRSAWYELVFLAIVAGITNIAFLVALTLGDVMRVMLLFYLSPLWSVIIARFWLKEKLSHQAIWLFALAMLGSMIMLWNPSVGWPWPHGTADWLALIASIAFSFNNVLSRKLASVSMEVKTAAVWWGVLIISALVLVIQQSPIPDLSAPTWLSAWLLGWVFIVTMTIAVLYGLARMPLYRSSVIMLFELVVAALSAWLLINQVMNLQEWIGGSLILLAGYLLAKEQK